MKAIVIMLLLTVHVIAQDVSCCGCPDPIQFTRIVSFSECKIDSELIISSNDRDFANTPIHWSNGTRYGSHDCGEDGYSLLMDSPQNGSLVWSELSSDYITQTETSDSIILSVDFSYLFSYLDSCETYYLKIVDKDDLIVIDSLLGTSALECTKKVINSSNGAKSIAVGHRAMRDGVYLGAIVDNVKLTWRKPLDEVYFYNIPESYTTDVNIVRYNGGILQRQSGALYTVTLNSWDYDSTNHNLYVNVGENPNTDLLEISPPLNDTIWYGWDGFVLDGVVYKKHTVMPSVVKYNESVLMYLSSYKNSPQQLYSGSWTWNNDTLYVRVTENPNTKKVFTCYMVSVSAVDSGTVSMYPNQVTYALNQSVIITATPNTGWSFTTWRGTFISRQSIDTITVTGNQVIWARFKKTEQEYRVIISGDNLGGHEDYMLSSFKAGYESWGGVWNNDNTIIIPSLPSGGMFRKADEYGAELVIRSYTDWVSQEQYAIKYYPTYYFAPVGANWSTKIFNSDGILPTTILTGVGTDSCVTAYDVEFIGNDPVSDSSSNWLILPDNEMNPCSVTVNGSVNVVGVNSHFVSGLSPSYSYYYFSPGERIVVNGEVRVVTEVIDNTHLTVNLPFFSSGTFSPAYQIQNLSSFSNPYIAGQMLYIADQLGVDVWTVRYLMRSLNTYAGKKGFGVVNKDQIMNAYNVLMSYRSLDYYLGL